MIATTHLWFSTWLLLLAATLGYAQTRDTNTLVEELPILSAGKAQAETLSLYAWGIILNGNGADTDTVADAYPTAFEAAETAHELQPKNIEGCNLLGYIPAEAAILIEQALDLDGTVRDPVKLDHAGERRNLRQPAPLN